MVSSTLRPHFTPGKDAVPIVQEAGWAPGPAWTGGKSRPHRDSIPDRPARSSVAIPTELPGPHTYKQCLHTKHTPESTHYLRTRFTLSGCAVDIESNAKENCLYGRQAVCSALLYCANCPSRCVLAYFLVHSCHILTPTVHTCSHILYVLFAHPVLISRVNLKRLHGRSHLSSQSTIPLRKAVEG